MEMIVEHALHVNWPYYISVRSRLFDLSLRTQNADTNFKHMWNCVGVLWWHLWAYIDVVASFSLQQLEVFEGAGLNRE